MQSSLRPAGDAQSMRRAFICGCGHSGTTLIAVILGTHPEIYVPRTETGIFMPKLKNFRRLARISYLYQATPFARRRAFQALEKEAIAQGRPYVVEKTPGHIRHLDKISKTFPDAKFIIPVRNGRDTTYSLFKRTGDFDKATDRWISDVRLSAAQQGKPNALVYRHEDLVRNTRKTLENICRFLEVPFLDTLVDFHKSPQPWTGQKESDHISNREWQVNQPIFDSSGKWRKEFTEADFHRLASGEGLELMKTFGYDTCPASS